MCQPVQVHKELQVASQRLAAHPHQLLLPEPCGLSWADIALATAINKCVEVQRERLPAPAGNTPHGAGAAGGAAAAGQGQGSAAGAAVISFMPLTQQLLQAHPELVEWADATVRRYWPDGVSTLHTAGGKAD